jgi:uncharacterized protein YndB with AHSA1/START domain
VVDVELTTRIAAPRDRVWGIVADHEGMPAWFPVCEVIRRDPGSPDPNGVGAVRVVRALGLAIEERVTAFEPEERLEYALTQGAPVRDHRGEVVLACDGDGTRVRWRVRLRPLVPGTGWIVERALRRMLRRGLEGLARRAQSG